MLVLAQFLFRLSFGLSFAMALTSPRDVPSGYFRNHLYVLLGLNSMGCLVALAAPERFSLWPPLAAAILSYIGSALWLYEKHRAGILVLGLLSAVSLTGSWLATEATGQAGVIKTALVRLDPPSGGLVLGVTMAAMLLGHWYLNSPTMRLAPLMRLVGLMGIVILTRAVLSGIGLGMELNRVDRPETTWLLFVSLRWLSGLIGGLVVAWMTWQTLKIPNTQSATGILYVGVILTFVGELTSQLLLMSNAAQYPV